MQSGNNQAMERLPTKSLAFNVYKAVSRHLNITKGGEVLRRQTKVKGMKLTSFVSFYRRA